MQVPNEGLKRPKNREETMADFNFFGEVSDQQILNELIRFRGGMEVVKNILQVSICF